MSTATKLGVLGLHFLGLLVLPEMVLPVDTPTDNTILALQQFEASDAKAEALRTAELCKNDWLLAAPLLLTAAAGLLFWDDVANWWRGIHSTGGELS